MQFDIEPDIRKASTLPKEIYSPATFAQIVERVLVRSWHVVSDIASTSEPQSLCPVTLLEGSVAEPLLLTRDDARKLHALSNVCTHRGNILVREPCTAASIRCRYHGRRFALDGSFSHMPEFDDAAGFPSKKDDLPQVPIESWGPLLFASLSPATSFADLLRPVTERVAFLPDMTSLRADVRHYEISANFLLYCENYLEGFHVPFVHHSLAETLDYQSYATELFEHGTLQIGIAKTSKDCFELPIGHRDRGKNVAGYYFFVFPATMINVYPWGMSVNAVRPVAHDRTRVTYMTFVHDASKKQSGAGADLERVEQEDQAVVCGVQDGVRSRLYDRGRFSPSRETGVHHFQKMIARMLA